MKPGIIIFDILEESTTAEALETLGFVKAFKNTLPTFVSYRNLIDADSFIMQSSIRVESLQQTQRYLLK